MPEKPDPSTPGSLHRPDERQQVNIDGIEIVGGFEQGTTVGSDRFKAVNITGGTAGHNVYQVVSRGDEQTIEFIQKEIDQSTGLTDGQKEELRQVAQKLDEALNEEEKDSRLISFLLMVIGGISTDIQSVVVDWILRKIDLPDDVRKAAMHSVRT
jgi:hypothetical protein